MKVEMLKIKDILRDTSWNCRGPVSPIEVVDLMKDIDKNGLISPVCVIPWDKGGYKYKLVAGFCRTQAFVQLNREEIPAIVQHNLTDTDARVLNLRENLLRTNLNIVQEANAIKPLRQEGLSEKAIAKAFGKSLTWVTVRLQLLQLPMDIQHVAASGILTQEQIKKIYNSPKEEQHELVRKIKTKTFKLDDLKITKPMPVAFKRNNKEIPSPKVVEAVLERLYDVTGATIMTRMLAWISGHITYNDFKVDLLKHLEDEGFNRHSYKDDL